MVRSLLESKIPRMLQIAPRAGRKRKLKLSLRLNVALPLHMKLVTLALFGHRNMLTYRPKQLPHFADASRVWSGTRWKNGKPLLRNRRLTRRALFREDALLKIHLQAEHLLELRTIRNVRLSRCMARPFTQARVKNHLILVTTTTRNTFLIVCTVKRSWNRPMKKRSRRPTNSMNALRKHRLKIKKGIIGRYNRRPIKKQLPLKMPNILPGNAYGSFAWKKLA